MLLHIKDITSYTFLLVLKSSKAFRVSLIYKFPRSNYFQTALWYKGSEADYAHFYDHEIKNKQAH